MAEVQIPLALQPFSGGRASVAAAGRTLRQVFDRLELECPGIREQLVADDDVRPGLAIVVDDEITQQGLAQGVAEDSNILILPALGGGSLHDSGGATRSVMRRDGSLHDGEGATPSWMQRDASLHGGGRTTPSMMRRGGSLHDGGRAMRSVTRRTHVLRLDEEIARSWAKRDCSLRDKEGTTQSWLQRGSPRAVDGRRRRDVP